jgi:chloramphenicol 3-O phosphotransferase
LFAGLGERHLAGTSRVVVLNGVGSSGKSSIARALQSIAAESFLHVEMDAFIDMLPPSAFGQSSGLMFETIEQDGRAAVVIKSGPTIQRLMRGMRRAIAALAAQGNNLIVDDVWWEGEEQDYRALLDGFDVRFVAIHAPLDELEARERERGDRIIGLARWQFGRVHKGVSYDLEIDTTGATPMECAEAIKEAFRL